LRGRMPAGGRDHPRNLPLNMNTSAPEDWRTEALRRMEEPEPLPLEAPPSSISPGIVIAKVALLLVFAAVLFLFGGFGWLIALAIATWYFFWPR